MARSRYEGARLFMEYLRRAFRWCATGIIVCVSAEAAAAQLKTPEVRKARSADTVSTLLAGAVFDNSGDVPVENAEVWFPTLKRAVRTDSLGRYQVAGLPMGTHLLLVRRLGYEAISATVTVRTTEPMPVDFLLTPSFVKLDKMVVTASVRSRRLAEFEGRMKFGMGHFLTEDYFKKNPDRTLADIVSTQLAGVRTSGRGSSRIVESTRNGGSCPVQVILDGMSVYNGTVGQVAFDINSIQSRDVIGLEYYTVATTPVQFNTTSGGGGSSCGTLVLWTR